MPFLNNLESKTLYSINSILYFDKLPSTLGFETQCQTYSRNLQDGNKMKIKDNLDVTSDRGRNQYGDIDHTNTICHICGNKETHIDKRNGSFLWSKYKTDESGNYSTKGTNWNGKSYVCKLCYESQRYQESEIKANAKFRNKQLSKDTSKGKGYIGEQIWCKRWGTVNCNIEMDNFSSPIDHPPHPEYGIVNSKIATFDEELKRWRPNTRGEYDNLACICMNKDWNKIERVYIIPKEIIGNITGLSIKLFPEKDSWYEKYKIDETPYNEAYHSMNLKDCPVLKDETNEDSKNIDKKEKETEKSKTEPSKIEQPKTEEPKKEFKKKVFIIRKK